MKNFSLKLNSVNKIITLALLVLIYSCTELQRGDQLSMPVDLAGSKYAALSPSILDQAFCSDCPLPKMPDPASSGKKPALAQEKQLVTIYPTGEYPTDLLNVQAVVDNFGQQGIDGTIVLKARNTAGEPTSFIFGGASNLLVWGSNVGQSGGLNFVGERDGAAMTTIIGSNAYRTMYFIAREGDFSFRDIKFSGGGIVFWYDLNPSGLQQEADNIEIKDCVFIDCNFPIVAGQVNESLTIKDNEIQNALGGIIPSYSDADILIADNHFTNNLWWAIDLYRLNGHAQIRDNTIELTLDPNDTPGPNQGGSGILIVMEDGGTVEVKDNFIRNPNYNGSGIGIVDSYGHQSNQVYSENTIELDQANAYWGAIEISNIGGRSISDLCFQENTITGVGGYAIWAYSYPLLSELPGEIFDLTFSDNDLTSFNSIGADVYLESNTYDNLVCGAIASFIDEGVNNTFTTDDCPDCR